MRRLFYFCLPNTAFIGGRRLKEEIRYLVGYCPIPDLLAKKSQVLKLCMNSNLVTDNAQKHDIVRSTSYNILTKGIEN